MVLTHAWPAFKAQVGRIEAEESRRFPCPVDPCTFAPKRAEELCEHLRKHHPDLSKGEIIVYRIDVVYGVNKKVGHPDFFPWRKLLPNGQIVKLQRNGQIVNPNGRPRKRKAAVEEPSGDSTSGTTESGTTEAGTADAGTPESRTPGTQKLEAQGVVELLMEMTGVVKSLLR